MQNLFQRAVETTGEEYLAAEAELRAELAQATRVLDENRTSTDPVRRLLASYLLTWRDSKVAADYQGALQYLEEIPKRLAKTPVGTPPPTGVATELERRFAGSLVDLAAVRLLKETAAPRWRTLAWLFYLERHPAPAINAGLIRFAADTADPKSRSTAAAIVKASRDPDVEAKLRLESERQRQLGKGLPPELAALGPPGHGH